MLKNIVLKKNINIIKLIYLTIFYIINNFNFNFKTIVKNKCLINYVFIKFL